ncbi:MAG: tyrosine-type recombinase/integrase [Bacteroidetes bacterium]|nr:tyrosine-type recombinase/integrase [Bacteroidota bacterium]
MRKKLATCPILKVSKGIWFIYFSVRDPNTNKMKPVKKYEGFNNCKNDNERRKHGENLIVEYTEKLKSGWSPFNDKENVIYSDQLEYHNFIERFNTKRKAAKNTRFFLNEYISIKSQGLKARSISTYISKLRIFCNWIDYRGYTDYDISEINNKIILEFFTFLIIKRKLDKISIEKYEQITKDYFNYLLKKKLISQNPVFDIVKPPKLKDEAACPITKTDLKLLLNLINENDSQLYLACMFQYYLGLRPGQELRSLKIRDIDMYNHKVIVSEEISKTSRRIIDMSEQLVELCHHFNIHNYEREFYVFGKFREPGEEMLGSNTLRNRFNKYRDLLKFPKTYKFYSMKHTGGGRLLESGRTLEELRNHFGHTSILSTDHYVRKHFGNRNKNIIYNFPSPV